MNEDEIISKLEIQRYDFRVILGRTTIDYDPDKEIDNRKKHGYSLESAIHLLEKLILPIPSTPFITSEPFEENGEVRHMHMGVDDTGRVILMVTTMRSDEMVRVISFRRANKKERVKFYELTGYEE
ncbi:MAG: BrnT family toxin [Candidatus Thorarchaeota archaeon]